MTPMLRLKLERFDLATEQEKPETYNREFGRIDVLEATVDVHNMRVLLTILQNFLDGQQPQIAPGAFREIRVQP